MEDSVLMEFAQFVCAGVTAMGDHITPIAWVAFEGLKSMTRLVRLIMVKGYNSVRHQSFEYSWYDRARRGNYGSVDG